MLVYILIYYFLLLFFILHKAAYPKTIASWYVCFLISKCSEDCSPSICLRTWSLFFQKMILTLYTSTGILQIVEDSSILDLLIEGIYKMGSLNYFIVCVMVGRAINVQCCIRTYYANASNFLLRFRFGLHFVFQHNIQLKLYKDISKEYSQ